MEERLTWDDVVLLLDDVKAMARGVLRREHGASLQTTALVVSALRRQRYADQDWQEVTWPNRQYFFGALYRAMARVVLARRGVTCAGTYVVEPVDPREDHPLAEAEEFVAAWAAAAEGRLDGSQVSALALRSAEVAVVDNALRGGARPENLVFGPTVTYWSEAAPS